MADVSHELGALRFVVESPLSSKVAMFNNQAQQHKTSQSLNPFSQPGSRASSPKPTFSKDEYGKPLAGSLTEMRGQKANMHVMREMLELCQIISSEGYDVKDEPTMRVITFGELFNIYNYISDKCVGILLRARKYKLVDFEGEMLFQRRDDDVPIFLLKPILEIRRELEAKIEEIKRGASPAPQATSVLLDRSGQNKSDLSLPNSKRNSKSRSSSPKPPPTKIELEPVASLTDLLKNTTKTVATSTTLDSKPTVTIAATQTQNSENNDIISSTAEGTATPATLTVDTKHAPETVKNANLDEAIVNQTEAIQKEAHGDISIPEITVNKSDENNNKPDSAPSTEPSCGIPTIVIETSAVHVRKIETPTAADVLTGGIS